jgi:putative ABC transport system substrate-binding protein
VSGIRRREFVIWLGGGVATAWPFVARTQLLPGKVWRIGFLAGGTRPSSLESSFYGGFAKGMRELGYVEAKDFVIEWRFADGKYERYSDLAAELVRLNVDVIVLGSASAIRPAQQATNVIPIVMTTSTDPVGHGFVASLARPGGNTTGLASSQEDFAPKHIELLMTAVPKLSRVGFLMNPDSSVPASILKSAQVAAEKAGLTPVPIGARNEHELANAFAAFTRERVGAVMILADPLFMTHRQQIAKLALEGRFPTIFSRREYVEVGGLMSYGESLAEFYRRAASYVDKIFKGAMPTDLPVEQPTRFVFSINRKTADELGITIPALLFMFADEVID